MPEGRQQQQSNYEHFQFIQIILLIDLTHVHAGCILRCWPFFSQLLWLFVIQVGRRLGRD